METGAGSALLPKNQLNKTIKKLFMQARAPFSIKRAPNVFFASKGLYFFITVMILRYVSCCIKRFFELVMKAMTNSLCSCLNSLSSFSNPTL